MSHALTKKIAFNELTIGLDASNLRRGGGITHLIEFLSEAQPGNHGISKIVIWGSRELIKTLPERTWLEPIHCSLLDRSLPFRQFWQQAILPKLARSRCSLLFSPGGIVPMSYSPSVTMCRNMLPFDKEARQGLGFSLDIIRWPLIRLGQIRSFRKANGLIFLNEYAKSAIGKHLGDTGFQIVIPHGVNSRFRCLPRPSKGITEFSEAAPFRLLYVSIVSVYKNHWRVVEAVSKLRKEGVPVSLDLIGGIGDQSAYKKLRQIMLDEDPLSKWCVFHGNIAFAELATYYHKADAFVYASTCENLPNILLEAMAAGLPIACSNRGPMPEILGSNGVYFDPDFSYSISDALRRLIADNILRRDVALGAYQRALSFSWKTCADSTLEFLSNVARADSLLSYSSVSQDVV